MIAVGVKGDQCQVQAETPETNAQLGIGPEVCDAVVARSQPADRGRLTEVIPADELKRRVTRERLLEIDQPSDPRPIGEHMVGGQVPVQQAMRNGRKEIVMTAELIDSCLDPGRRQALCPTETNELVHRRIQAAQAHHRSPGRDRYGPIRPYEPTARHGDSVQRSHHLAGDPSQPPTSSSVLNLLERASSHPLLDAHRERPEAILRPLDREHFRTGTPTAAAAPIAQRSASNRHPSPARDTRTTTSRPRDSTAAWTSLTSPPTIRSHRTAESPDAAATIRPSSGTSVDRIEACRALRHAS